MMNKKILKFKALHIDAVIPTKAHPTDAGYDLYAVEDKWLTINKPTLIKTGIAMEIPKGCVGDIRPRSGLSAKGVTVAYGTVDSGYRGEVKVNMKAWCHKIHKGDRIAQLVVLPLVSFTTEQFDNELSKSDRGTKGFGSTGK